MGSWWNLFGCRKSFSFNYEDSFCFWSSLSKSLVNSFLIIFSCKPGPHSYIRRLFWSEGCILLTSLSEWDKISRRSEVNEMYLTDQEQWCLAFRDGEIMTRKHWLTIHLYYYQPIRGQGWHISTNERPSQGGMSCLDFCDPDTDSMIPITASLHSAMLHFTPS